MNLKEIVGVLREIPMFRNVEEKRLKLFAATAAEREDADIEQPP